MVIYVDSDPAYLVLAKAKSRIASYYFLSNYSNINISSTLNRAILAKYKGVKHVVTSLAKAETARVFYNTQTAILIQYILNIIDYKQLPIPIKTGNSTASGFINNNNMYQK